MERTKWTDDLLDERLATVDEKLGHLQSEVTSLRKDMNAGFADLRAEMHAGFESLASDLRSEIRTIAAARSSPACVPRWQPTELRLRP